MRLVVAVVVWLSAATTCAAAPLPDPPPHTGHKPVTITVGYREWLPAVNVATGKIVPGLWFHCTVPARWHGKPNVRGHRTCVLVRR